MKRIIVLIIIILALLSPAIIYAQDTAENRYGLEFFKKGVHHFNRKEYEASIDFFRKALGENPSDEKARFFLGMAYYKAGFDESAMFEFNNIIGNEQGDSILSNFVRYLSTKQFLLRRKKKSDDYTIGMEIRGNPLGKYILSKATGIDIDKTGNIYVAGFGSKIALKISQDGSPLLSFVSPKINHGRLYDIVVGKNGDVYISDFTNDSVYHFQTDGKYVGSLGSSGFKVGQFYGPTSLTLDENNDLYVVDSGNVRIEKFSENGDFLLTFGREGDGEGELKRPSGIAVDHAGNIYVSDHGKKTVQVYDRSGNFIRILEGGDLTDPYGISFTEDNRLIISDRDRLMSYDIMHSTWTEIDTGGRLKRVLDVKSDHLGQLYTCDFESDTILQFVPKADKYRNLNVILDRIDAESFPAVVYYVTVLDADGFPIYGLGVDNFLLRIGKGIVGKIDLSYNEVRNSRLRLLFLVDKSASMQQYSRDVVSYINQFVSKTSSNDEMAVIGFNHESWIASPFTRSKLRTANAILEEKYAPGKAFDTAFRRGIDYLNREFYKKAIIVVTDGLPADQSFQTYSLESCLRYAANNHIPVYFLSFEGKKDTRLDYFARSTGGKFYDVLHSNDFPYLYNTIKGFRASEYLIFFNDVYDPTLANFYLEAEVEVDYNGRVGKNRLGLIYP